MTSYAYPASAMCGDYLRAAAGFVPTAVLLVTLPISVVAATVLGGLAMLFAVFGARTILRHGTRFEMTKSALLALGLRRTSIAWSELESTCMSALPRRAASFGRLPGSRSACDRNQLWRLLANPARESR